MHNSHRCLAELTAEMEDFSLEELVTAAWGVGSVPSAESARLLAAGLWMLWSKGPSRLITSSWCAALNSITLELEQLQVAAQRRVLDVLRGLLDTRRLESLTLAREGLHVLGVL